MKNIKNYIVEDSQKNFSDVTSFVNTINYQGYSADLRFAGNGKIISSTLFDYELLLRQLKSLKNVRFISHHEFLTKNIEDFKNDILIAIRHDIDSDIIAAVQQAELETRLGIVSSWYILHTAQYYGFFKDDVFYRHVCNAYYYKKLYELGHEVGLHTDPLLIYQDYKINGAEAVKQEIDWLRSLGIDIYGTLAHNSESVYGAFNYEVFKGRNRKNEAILNDKWAPLGVLDEKEMQLVYEGNDLLRQKEFPEEYGAIRNTSEWRWVKYEKSIRKNHREIQYRFTNQDQVLHDISSVSPGTLITLVVHPLYYGSRLKAEKSPIKPLNRIQKNINNELGWETFHPNTLQSVTNFSEYHAVNFSNEWGMLDYLVVDRKYDNEYRVLFLGSDNTNAKCIGLKKHFTSYFSDLFNSSSPKKKVKIFKLSHDNFGIDRLYSWYTKVSKKINPDLIVLGMPEDIVRKNIPIIWCAEEGYSLEHTPGEYLEFNRESRSFQLKLRSIEWEIRQKNPKEIISFPNSDIEMNQVLSNNVKYQGMPIHDYLIELYTYVVNSMKMDCPNVILLQEDVYRIPISDSLTLSNRIAEKVDCDFIIPDCLNKEVNFSDGITLNQIGHDCIGKKLFYFLKDKDYLQ